MVGLEIWIYMIPSDQSMGKLIDYFLTVCKYFEGLTLEGEYEADIPNNTSEKTKTKKFTFHFKHMGVSLKEYTDLPDSLHVEMGKEYEIDKHHFNITIYRKDKKILSIREISSIAQRINKYVNRMGVDDYSALNVALGGVLGWDFDKKKSRPSPIIVSIKDTYANWPMLLGKRGVNLQTVSEILMNIADKSDPLLIYAPVDGEILRSEFEYYRDPYFFCFENTELDEGDYSCLKRESDSEIKKALPEKELLGLLEKYSDKVFHGKHGIGILKDIEKDPRVYPRYFIRKELRKRGVDIPEGFAEKYAKELGLE